MKKFVIPAMGVAAAFGMTPPAAADVVLSQLMIQGQPGYTGNVNRTAPTGSPGIAPLNTPVGPSPYAVGPATGYSSQQPFISQRGDLNAAQPELVAPGEPDSSGKINPTVDRARARFAGERGPDGKLLPTYSPQEAQAPSSSQTSPQAAPPTPSRSDMPGNQPSTTTPRSSNQPGAPARRPGSGASDTSTPAPHGTNQMGTMGASPQPTTRSQQPGASGTMGSGAAGGDSAMPGTRQQRMHSQGDKAMKPGAQTRGGQNAMSETAALNALSAEGYTNVGKIERVGGNWQATAMKDGKPVTVQVDPQNRVTAR